MPTYSDPTIIQLGDKPRIHPAAWLVVVAGVVSVLGAVLFFVEKVHITSETTLINADVATDQKQLATLKSTSDALVTLDNQAKDLHQLFDNQKQWNNVFATVDQRFYKNMTITSIQYDQKGSISFTGTTPTYTDYAKIYNSLTDVDGSQYFATVSPSAITKVADLVGGGSHIQFSFAATLQPKVLNTNVVLELINHKLVDPNNPTGGVK